MSASDWILLEKDIEDSQKFFSYAVRYFSMDQGSSFDDPMEEFAAQARFSYAMMVAHTSLEKAIERCLNAVGEQKPAGHNCHRDLLTIASIATENRPALLNQELLDLTDETRRFKHNAERNYENFTMNMAAPAAKAAGKLATKLKPAFMNFRASVDPDSLTNNGNQKG